MKDGDSARRGLVLALFCAAGAALLGASQLIDLFYLVGDRPRPLGAVDASSQHGLTNAILAASALALTCLGLLVGPRSNAGRVVFGAVALCGFVGILVFGLIDLPDIGATGTLDYLTGELTDARVEPAAGFWMELFGSLVLLAAGAVGALAGRYEPDAEGASETEQTPSGGQRAAP